MKSKVWITKHGGKMENIRSISTNPTTNEFCQAMHNCNNDRIICTKCYATSLVAFRKTLREHMEANSQILSERVLTLEELPKYDDELMRFHSFGEIINHTHVINIFNICYNNPQTYHVIYSKRCDMLADMIHLKPSNLKIVESNPLIDAVKTEPSSPYADLVFNVVTPKYLDVHPEYSVNCIQACDKCRLCYSRRTPMKFIVEKLK